MAKVELDLASLIKKGGRAESAKQWIDGWLEGALWDVLQVLANAGPDHIKLLEVQAQAKVLLNLSSAVGQDVENGKSAANKVAKK